MKVVLGKRGWNQGASGIGSFTLQIPPRSGMPLPAFTYAPQTLTAAPAKPTNLRAIFIAPSSSHEHFRKILLPALAHHFGHCIPPDTGSDSNKELMLECEDSQHDKRMYFILIATIPLADEECSSYILARDWLYDRKISSQLRAITEMVESVTKNLAEEWCSGTWVDEHMRDQLVIFQALAQGRAEVFPGWKDGDMEQLREASLHAKTAEWVARQILGVTFDRGGHCEGAGYGCA